LDGFDVLEGSVVGVDIGSEYGDIGMEDKRRVSNRRMADIVVTLELSCELYTPAEKCIVLRSGVTNKCSLSSVITRQLLRHLEKHLKCEYEYGE
jgi:hypothetical protein